MRQTVWTAIAIFTVLPCLPAIGLADDGAAPPAAPPTAALELFEQRIMPIFRSSQPSSCVQCHLSAVDLKDYILPSHEATFLALRNQGLVDLDHPQRSKILTLIQMGEKDLDRGARLIHQKTRQAEYEAFAAWIAACCNDPKLRDAPASDTPAAGPAKPLAVIRHARKSRVVDSFVRNVWSQRMRCYPCHTPHELATGPQNPQMLERQKESLAQYGLRMNIFHETPEATMQYLIQQSRRPSPHKLPMINLAEPSKSLLVLKPTSKLPPRTADGQLEKPSSAEPVSHGGGLKMHVDDASYKAFMAWIEDYANVVGDRYTSVADLPADNWHPTQQVLRLTNAPESWPVLGTVQLFVYAWDQARGDWQPEAVAFTQAPVTPRRMVNGSLFLLAADNEVLLAADNEGPDSVEKVAARPLAAGKYLIKAYVDAQSRLAEDPTRLLGDEDFQGQITVQAEWKEGFAQAEVVDGSGLKK